MMAPEEVKITVDSGVVAAARTQFMVKAYSFFHLVIITIVIIIVIAM